MWLNWWDAATGMQVNWSRRCRPQKVAAASMAAWNIPVAVVHSELAYRSVEGQGGKKAVMTDLVLGYFKDPKQSPLPTSSSCVQLMACCCRGSRAVVAKAGKG